MTSISTSPTETQPVGNWINGHWTDCGEIHQSIDPSTGDIVGNYHSAGATEGQEAIAAARKAFETSDWPSSTEFRARTLHELADSLERRVDELANTLCREGGKLLWETKAEVSLAANVLRLSAARARVLGVGQAVEEAPGSYWYNLAEPLGVAGIITPWNGPLLLSARSFGPALAAGCTVVVKLPGETAITNALRARPSSGRRPAAQKVDDCPGIGSGRSRQRPRKSGRTSDRQSRGQEGRRPG